MFEGLALDARWTEFKQMTAWACEVRADATDFLRLAWSEDALQESGPNPSDSRAAGVTGAVSQEVLEESFHVC